MKNVFTTAKCFPVVEDSGGIELNLVRRVLKTDLMLPRWCWW